MLGLIRAFFLRVLFVCALPKVLFNQHVRGSRCLL